MSDCVTKSNILELEPSVYVRSSEENQDKYSESCHISPFLYNPNVLNKKCFDTMCINDVYPLVLGTSDQELKVSCTSSVCTFIFVLIMIFYS